jgi:tetratricopeptide (TPR) repeat protein
MEKPSTLTHENNNTQMAEINKLLEDLDFESARVILEKKLKQEPNNVEYIDTLAEVLMNLDEAEATEKLIKKSISLEPNKNAEKYMTLGQLSDCRSAIKLYEKGISIFQGDLNMEIDDNKRVQIKSSLASGYAAIAELFMNSDLW